MKICIDAGHSGPVEPGACAEEFTESDVVLSISCMLADMCRNAGHHVLMTRIANIDDDGLEFRADKANFWGADLYLSIHANSFSDCTAHGTEVFYYPGSKEGEKLAGAVQESIVNKVGMTDRGIKTANFYVLRFTNMPACLVEVGFISNAEDRKKITESSAQMCMAYAILAGINKYLAK